MSKAKIVKLRTVYPHYLQETYEDNPSLKALNYKELKGYFDQDHFSWSNAFAKSMTPLGYEVQELLVDNDPVQERWFRDQMEIGPGLIPTGRMQRILFQLKTTKPQILFVGDALFLSRYWLKRFKQEVPSIKWTVGWCSVPTQNYELLREYDLVLSCSQDAILDYKKENIEAHLVHHGFDPDILEKIVPNKHIPLSFIGQIVRKGRFHIQREKFLVQMGQKLPVSIFSPSYYYKWNAKEKLKLGLKRTYYQFEKHFGPNKAISKSFPFLNRLVRYGEYPHMHFSLKLRPYLKKPLFGVKMFQTLSDSYVTFNKHLDESQAYACNMRLFEATGVGTCLLTDMKENLGELFDLEKELITYNNLEECLDKAKWYIEHPAQAIKIGERAKERVLKDHTIYHRAKDMDRIFTDTFLR